MMLDIKKLQQENRKYKARFCNLKNDYIEKSDYTHKLIERIDKALKLIESYELGKYDYSIPLGGIIELKDILKGASDE